MMEHGTSLSAAREHARTRAIRALAERLADRRERESLAWRLLDCWRDEIVDYRAPADGSIIDEELRCALENLDVLVASLESGSPVPDEHFERWREIAARRVYQGVPLESFLHAGRLWESVCWETVLSLARIDVPSEREAALEIAGRISHLAHRVATAATAAYLDEVASRGLLRRDLLDALLTASGDGNNPPRLARTLHLRLAENYVVVVVRGDGIAVAAAREQPLAARRRLDRIVEETRRRLWPSAGSLLVGMRNSDLVVLYPTARPADLDTVRQDCEALAGSLHSEVSIGMSGWHEGRAAVSTAFIEAMDAVEIAASTGIRGRAIGLEEVLIDSMLASSVPAQRILKETLKPLFNYDAARDASLIKTLRGYLDAHLNVAKSAEALFVNPNTVVYRLRRIKELCGRDPRDPDDRLVLSLALKLKDLRS